VFGEIRGSGPVWDVESGGTICVLVADCQPPQSGARLKPEILTVTFDFSPTHDFFDHKGSRPVLREAQGETSWAYSPAVMLAAD
jgi:hypothetical protein